MEWLACAATIALSALVISVLGVVFFGAPIYGAGAGGLFPGLYVWRKIVERSNLTRIA